MERGTLRKSKHSADEDYFKLVAQRLWRVDGQAGVTWIHHLLLRASPTRVACVLRSEVLSYLVNMFTALRWRLRDNGHRVGQTHT